MLDFPQGKDDALIPDKQVAARYHRSVKTIDRWTANPDLKFPEPIVIQGRKYRRLSELMTWERLRAAASASKTVAA